MPTYFLQTYGCQANEADSAKVKAMFRTFGFIEVGDPSACDVLIINSCSVRQKSEDKVYGIARKLPSPKPLVVLMGCMVGSVAGNRTRYSFDELRKRTPWVDAYIEPSQLEQLPSTLFANNLISRAQLDNFDWNRCTDLTFSHGMAFVNISYGCDNFCTYCVVPYSRGPEISRPKEAILEDVKHLLANGYTKVTLCGQNVNSWQLSKDEKFKLRTRSEQKLPFAALLREVHDLTELEEVAFMSSNPFDFTQDLVETLALPKISSYIHIAVQSGNNEILTKMHRRHTVEEFVNLVEHIRHVKPAARISTDIIVGFSGETREQFMDTVALFKTVKFSMAFISMYSPRKGTYAEQHYADDIPLEEKKWRHAYLTKIWKETLND